MVVAGEQRERWGPTAGRHLPERTIQVGTVDKAELGVGPVELLLLQVDGQPVGPVNVGVHYDFPGAAIHPCPLDSRCLAPVCPVHVPDEGEEHEQRRLAHVCFLSLFSVYTKANAKTETVNSSSNLAHER